MTAEHDDRLALLLEGLDPTWGAAPATWSAGAPIGNGQSGAVVWCPRPDVVALTVDDARWWIPGRFTPPPGTVTWSSFTAALEGRDSDWPADVYPIGPTRRRIGDRPTRCPPARVELRLGGGWHVGAMRLDLLRATARLEVAHPDGRRAELRCRVDAEHPLPACSTIVVDGTAMLPVDVAVRPPGTTTGTHPFGAPFNLVRRQHGLPEPTAGAVGDDVVARQRLPGGLEAAVVARTRADGWVVAVGVDEAACHGAACAATGDRARHERWWDAWWRRSWIDVPDESAMRAWAVGTYHLGAVSAPDGEPIGLQAVWSPDGAPPPWGGDLHHNINVQMSYWPAITGNRTAALGSLRGFLRRAWPSLRAVAADVFGVDGAFLVHATDQLGRPMWDWPIGHLELGNGALLLQVLWRALTATGDETDLAETVAWMEDLVGPVWSTAVVDAERFGDELAHLPWCHSPEYPDADQELGPDATYDLELLHWLLAACADGCDRLGRHEGAARHRDRARSLARPAVDTGSGLGILGGRPAGGMRVRRDRPLERSHRHHSHLVALAPLDTLDLDDAAARRAATDSLDTLIARGTGEWVGFSFAWAAAIAARLGDGDAARSWVDRYVRSWMTAGGFMLQRPLDHGADSLWRATRDVLGDCLTLESTLGAASAVQDMLLLAHGDVVRLFPAVPADWGTAALTGLLATRGVVVTARLDGERIEATLDNRTGRTARLTVVLPDGERRDVEVGAGAALDIVGRRA